MHALCTLPSFLENTYTYVRICTVPSNYMQAHTQTNTPSLSHTDLRVNQQRTSVPTPPRIVLAAIIMFYWTDRHTGQAAPHSLHPAIIHTHLNFVLTSFIPESSSTSTVFLSFGVLTTTLMRLLPPSAILIVFPFKR